MNPYDEGYQRALTLAGLLKTAVDQKTSKEEAEYVDVAPNVSEQCQGCKHYRETRRCDLVQGVINPEGWCKYYETETP